MNFVVALLLLTAGEEDAFWMLVSLVGDVLPRSFYDRTMMGATVEIDLLGRPPIPSSDTISSHDPCHRCSHRPRTTGRRRAHAQLRRHAAIVHSALAHMSVLERSAS